MSNEMQRKLLVRLVVASLVAASVPAPVAAGGARLEGYLLDVDARAATGYRVHLIDAEGRKVANSPTTEAGVYRFRDLAAGSYSLGVENAEGQLAPVAAPPLRIGADELARRDIKLVAAGEAERDAVVDANTSLGVMWAGLSPWARAWVVIGTFVVLGITVKALDDGERRGTEDGR